MRRPTLVPVLALLGALLVVPAVPAVAAAPPPTAAAPTAQAQDAPPETADVVLTLADDGATRTVTVGQTVLVSLDAPDVLQPWQGPVGSEPLRLEDYQEHESWYGRPQTRAEMRAVSGGTVRLDAATDPVCLHDVTPCRTAVRRWSATVVVLGASARPTPPPEGPASCTVSGGGPDPEVLTLEDAGTTVTVRVGETVVVGLLGCGAPYTVPTSDSPVVRRTAPSLDATDLSRADFVAGRPGTATLSATRGDRRWSATVVVVAGDCVRVTEPSRPSVFGAQPGALPPPQVGGLGFASWTVTGTFRSARAVQAGYRRTSSRATTPLTQAEVGAPVDLARPADVDRELTLRTSSRSWLVVDAVCQDGTTQRVDSRAQAVLLYPQPTVSLAARRLAPRDYVFSGRVRAEVPRTVLLYRQSGLEEPVLLARTTTTASGAWSLRRRFLGTGRFDVHAETVGDGVLGTGRSGSRPTVVH